MGIISEVTVKLLSDGELSDYCQIENCQVAFRWKTVRLLSDGRLSDYCQMENCQIAVR